MATMEKSILDLELEDLEGVGPTKAKKLMEAGISSVVQLATASADEVAVETGWAKDVSASFIMTAQKLLRESAGVFKDAYKNCGIDEEYFYIHPVHALRHVGAHYWLARPEVSYNHTLVARIGGWKSPQTLIDCYGELPEEFVIQRLTGGVAVPLHAA